MSSLDRSDRVDSARISTESLRHNPKIDYRIIIMPFRLDSHQIDVGDGQKRINETMKLARDGALVILN
jgi:hypothetical protein